MSVPFTHLQTLINFQYMPRMIDVMFTERSALVAKMKNNNFPLEGDETHFPLEYVDSGNPAFIGETDNIELTKKDTHTKGKVGPEMLLDTITVSIEEAMKSNSPKTVKTLMDARMNNVRKSVEKKFLQHFFSETAGVAANDEWNNLTNILSTSTTLHSLAVADVSSWKATVLENSNFGDDITDVTQIDDPTKDCYLPQAMARLAAVIEYKSGEAPGDFYMTRYLWDLLERILNASKTGSPMQEMIGNYGFTALRFRDRQKVFAENQMDYAQSSATAGRIACLKLDYLKMGFNKAGKFKVDEFVRHPQNPVKVSNLYVFGNTVCTNRPTQGMISGYYSKKAYTTG